MWSENTLLMCIYQLLLHLAGIWHKEYMPLYNSTSLFQTYHIILIHKILCFFYWQPCPVVHQAHYQTDRDTTTARLLGVLSLTSVTQGTGWPQVTLVEYVSLVAAGQGVIQHVPVSWCFVAYVLIIDGQRRKGKVCLSSVLIYTVRTGKHPQLSNELET